MKGDCLKGSSSGLTKFPQLAVLYYLTVGSCKLIAVTLLWKQPGLIEEEGGRFITKWS